MPGRLCLVGLLFAAASVAAAPPSAVEENILCDAGVPADGDGLLAFFRGRTLTDPESKRIGELIRRLGGDDFDEREAAAKELRKIGGRATPLVRAAAHSPDAEVARQAQQFLKDVTPLPPLPAVAAARLLARQGSADAAPVLLAYLPFADDPAVEDEVFAALVALTPEGKPDPALAAALDDVRPIRRAAAAYVLGRRGDPEQQAAVRKRLDDADASVRWQAAAALLAVHDRSAVPALVGLLGEGPFDMAWRAEEALRRLAGEAAPAVWLDDSREGRTKCRDAWAAWWKDKGAAFDLSEYREPDRPLGYTLAVEYNTGRVWECDLDGTIRWEIEDLDGPMDAQVLPNGHVLIAEADAHRITERDLKGVVLWEKKVDGEPNGCQRLVNGNTFVSTYDSSLTNRNRVTEFKPDGTVAYSIELGGESFANNAVRKSRDGDVVYLWEHGLAAMDVTGKYRHDRHFKPWRIQLPAGQVQYVDLQELPAGRFLVSDSRSGRVLEVNARGDVIWQADVPGACGVMRLRNGHTLVGANHKAVELDADGKMVWRKDTEGYVRRVYRR